MSQPLGILDILKGLCAVSAALVGGAVMLWGPQEIRKDISDTWRHLLGGAFVAFGCAFGLAIVFASRSDRRSQAAAGRIKGLLLAMVCAALLAAVAMTKGRDVYAAWRLQRDGAAAQAVVLERRMKVYQSKTTFVYVIRYGDHRATVSLPHSAKRGDTVPVLYLPDEPQWVLYGRQGDGFVAIVDQTTGKWWAVGFAALALLCAVLVLAGLKAFAFGTNTASGGTK